MDFLKLYCLVGAVCASVVRCAKTGMGMPCLIEE